MEGLQSRTYLVLEITLEKKSVFCLERLLGSVFLLEKYHHRCDFKPQEWREESREGTWIVDICLSSTSPCLTAQTLNDSITRCQILGFILHFLSFCCRFSVSILFSTGTAMAAGVLLQNELPYSSLIESSVYLANMNSGKNLSLMCHSQ